MARVRYEGFPKPFMSGVMMGGGMRGVVRREAEVVAAKARSLAPVDDGKYRDSIKVTMLSGGWFRGGRDFPTGHFE